MRNAENEAGETWLKPLLLVSVCNAPVTPPYRGATWGGVPRILEVSPPPGGLNKSLIKIESDSIRFMGIFVGVSQTGVVKRHWGGRQRRLLAISVATSSKLLQAGPPLVSYAIAWSLLRYFQRPRNMWPWITEWPLCDYSSYSRYCYEIEGVWLPKFIEFQLLKINPYYQRENKWP